MLLNSGSVNECFKRFVFDFNDVHSLKTCNLGQNYKIFGKVLLLISIFFVFLHRNEDIYYCSDT